MNSETRSCQNCAVAFDIEPADFDFYKKMAVPPPTWCPQCRMTRRFSFMNIWSLYKRNCTKCGKNMMSIYAPEKDMVVWCLTCWWADDWDGTEYGMDYDPSRPFLEQVLELARKTPWQTLECQYLTLTNSDYTNAIAHAKNCYLVFWADYSENAYYSTFLNGLKDSLDCYRMNDSELCYEDVGCTKCYHTFFSEECEACTNVWFSRACFGCTDCFGCVNLRNKSYHIFNEKYSKEDYFKKLKEFQLDSSASLAQMRRRVYEFWDKYPRRAYIGNSLNVNVSGDYIYQSKNSKDVYMVSGTEDCRYTQFVSVPKARDCYDYSGWGNGAEKIYEACVIGEGANNVKFSNECWPDVFDIEYSIYTIASKHAFGCVNLKRKDYSILNKQYSKEEYEKLAAQIREDMVKNPYIDSQGRAWPYGEYLLPELSRFAYNETMAQEFFPKTKDQALAEGYTWHEGEPNQYTITIQGSDLPDTIAAADDSILKETIGCAECGKAFRLVPGEIALMRKLGLPLPHACFNCRQKARFARSNPPRLYKRTCAKCAKPIETSYAPERPEIIYCEACYQAEVV